MSTKTTRRLVILLYVTFAVFSFVMLILTRAGYISGGD